MNVSSYFMRPFKTKTYLSLASFKEECLSGGVFNVGCKYTSHSYLSNGNTFRDRQIVFSVPGWHFNARNCHNVHHMHAGVCYKVGLHSCHVERPWIRNLFFSQMIHTRFFLYRICVEGQFPQILQVFDRQAHIYKNHSAACQLCRCLSSLTKECQVQLLSSLVWNRTTVEQFAWVTVTTITVVTITLNAWSNDDSLRIRRIHWWMTKLRN